MVRRERVLVRAERQRELLVVEGRSREAVPGGAAKGGAAVTLSAPAQRAVRPSFRNESLL